MILAVASGKGGTGKTTVALNLAKTAAGPVCLMDCDVEEPNCGLFLGSRVLSREAVEIPVPEVDAAACNACGECSRFCAYHAIALLGDRPLVFPELCHGCGGCFRVCPQHAIREAPRPVGEVEIRQAGAIRLVQGTLNVGSPLAPPVIRAVKARRPEGALTVIDAPPGTACPAVTALRGADAALLVTEPTPFGLHDLKLAVAVAREIGVPFGVVVNRAGSGDDRVRAYCRAEGIAMLLEIPDDRRVAEAYARGVLMTDLLPETRALFQTLWKRSTQLAGTVPT